MMEIPDPLAGLTPDQLLALHTQLGGQQSDPLAGMSADDLQKAYSALPPKQMEGLAREVALPASSAAAGITTALGTPGDMLRGAIHGYSKYIGAPLSSFVSREMGGGDVPVLSGETGILPTSDRLLADTNAMGITNRPDLTPQNTRERYEAAGAQGLGSAIPFALSGNLPQAGMALTQGFGAGLGSKLGQDVSDTLPEALKPYAKTLLPLALSLAGGGMAGGAYNAGAKGIGLATGATSPIVEAYKRQGVEPVLAGDVTQNRTLQGFQSMASKAPFGSDKIANASQNALTQFGSAVDRIADNLGGSSTLQEAGTHLQGHGADWLKDFKDTQATNWNAIDSKMQNAPLPVGNVASALSDLKAQAGGNPALEDFLQSPLAKKVSGILSDAKANSIGVPELNWEQGRALRTRIGEYLDSPDLISEAGGAQAKQFWGALSNDMKTSIAASGDPAAQQLFADANAHSSAGHQFIESVLNPIMAKGVNPSDAATNILSSAARGGETLQAIRQNLPGAADELGALVIRRGAHAVPSAQDATRQAVSPNSWLTNFDPVKRMSPEASSALFPDAKTKADLADLDTIAGTMRSTQKFANPSGTGGNMQHAAMFAAPMAIAEGGRLGSEVGGVPGAIAGAISGGLPFAAGPLAAGLTASPSITKFLAAQTPKTDIPFSTLLRLNSGNAALLSGLRNGLQGVSR